MYNVNKLNFAARLGDSNCFLCFAPLTDYVLGQFFEMKQLDVKIFFLGIFFSFFPTDRLGFCNSMWGETKKIIGMALSRASALFG